MRFVSLYYSSIGFKECFKLFFAFLISPFVNKNSARKSLNEILSPHFGTSKVYPYSTSRSALASFLRTINLSPGDEIILSSFTCLAVPTAVIAAGGTPIYVDIDRNSLNTTVDQLLSAVTSKTRVIVIQHTFGNPADVETLVKTLKNKNILIIEDCALSIGAKINDSLVGSFADASIFSFELSKTISVGWGGILIVNNSKLFDSADLFYNSVAEKSGINTFKDVFQTMVSSICHSPSFYFFGKYIIYVFFRIGLFRYSTTDEEINLNFNKGFIFKLNFPFMFLAAHQLSRMQFITENCNRNYHALRYSFVKNGFVVPDKNSFDSDFLFLSPSRISIFVGDKIKFIEFFNKNNIEVGLWFDGPLSPLPKLESFQYNREKYPEACFAADHIVNLPCHSRMTNIDLKKIDNLIQQFANVYPDLVAPKSY